MTTPTFSEVIKIKDGVFYNLSFHAERMNKTTCHFFGKPIALVLTPAMIPVGLRNGLVKCRIVYAEKILNMEFVPYNFKPIYSVAIVCDNTIDYSYKSTERSRLNALLENSGCDEIIIVKNGFVTDTSFANLVFEDASGLYTPATCLLSGTKRACLLQKRIIAEREVKLLDLEQAKKIRLINAMIDLEDNIFLPSFTFLKN